MLVNYWDNYTEMHGQQNAQKNSKYLFQTINHFQEKQRLYAWV